MNDDEQLTRDDVFEVIKEVPIPFNSLQGMLPTISAVPTYIPTSFSDQFRLYYVSGANAYFYAYDVSSKSWHSATLS